MTVQIRLKQKATELAQNKLNNKIRVALEEQKDKSGNKIVEAISKDLQNELIIAQKNSKYFADNIKDIIRDVGYPICFNKTALQLEMALNRAEARGIELITDMENGLLHNGLSNKVEQFPVLQAPSTTEFYGNENASVSTVLIIQRY
jgi:hypothetical protein